MSGSPGAATSPPVGFRAGFRVPLEAMRMIRGSSALMTMALLAAVSWLVCFGAIVAALVAIQPPAGTGGAVLFVAGLFTALAAIPLAGPLACAARVRSSDIASAMLRGLAPPSAPWPKFLADGFRHSVSDHLLRVRTWGVLLVLLLLVECASSAVGGASALRVTRALMWPALTLPISVTVAAMRFAESASALRLRDTSGTARAFADTWTTLGYAAGRAVFAVSLVSLVFPTVDDVSERIWDARTRGVGPSDGPPDTDART